MRALAKTGVESAGNIADRCEALGRSRGGLGTKLVGVCDAAGRLLDFLLVPGQAHELAPSLTLLRRLPDTPSWVLADRACDAAAFRAEMLAAGAVPVVPSRRGAKDPQPCPDYIYRLPQPDRTLLVPPQGTQGGSNSLRQNRHLLCRNRRHRRFARLDQVAHRQVRKCEQALVSGPESHPRKPRHHRRTVVRRHAQHRTEPHRHGQCPG